MPIPEHICRALVCGADLDRDQFADHLDSREPNGLPWFLFDNEARQALMRAVFEHEFRLDLAIYEVVEKVEAYKYLELNGTEGEIRSLLALPEVAADGVAPPTSALTRLARAWPSRAEIVDQDEPSAVPDPLRNKIVIFSSGRLAGWSDIENFVASLSGVCIAGPDMQVGPPAWTSATRFEIGAASIAPQSLLMAGRLMREVLLEERVRWRFISLYRVFEAAYLLKLKEKLAAEFLQQPKRALTDAQAALESELSTFQDLVNENAGLVARFEEIDRFVDANNTNRFLQAIKRTVKAAQKFSGFRKGVAYCYKVRCAIVHAGQHDVVFDRFPDAESGVQSLVPLFEASVIELLGLRSQ